MKNLRDSHVVSVQFLTFSTSIVRPSAATRMDGILIFEGKVVYLWAELTQGLRFLCIKIGYNEPKGAESREETSTLAESSRVT